MFPSAESSVDVPPRPSSLHLLASVLEPLVQCACVYSSDGRMLFANPSLTRWLGRTEADLRGKRLTEIWPEGFAAREAADLRTVLESGRMEQLESRPSPAGTRQVRAVKYPWEGAEDTPVVVVVFEDSPAASALDRPEQLGWLAMGIVHDFNNTLTLLRGHVEMMQLIFNGGREQLGAMDRLLEHACQLPRQLLSFVRETAPVRQMVDVNTLLRSLEGLLRSRTAGRISLEFRLDPTGVWMEADPVQLTQAFLNLANNAIDAMQDEGRLLIQTVRQGTTARISFEDTGPGLPPEALARIFEPLYTTRKGGSGLGLVVVREVVRRHGGRIGCQSEPGQGARFTIELPVLPGNPVRPVSPSHLQSNILVLDPEVDIAKLSSMILEQGGHRVSTCVSLQEATQVEGDFETLLICASLLDEPGKVWLEEWLHQHPKTRLVLTSTGPIPELNVSCQRRLQAMISKPYSAELLLEAVRSGKNVA